MGRAEDWPDPRSRKWKIGDIHSVGRHANISSSKFQIIRTTIVPTARSWSLKPVPWCTFDFDLTWSFDLGSQNLHTRCLLELCAGLPNSYLRKTGGGRICPPPPSSARVNNHEREYVCLCDCQWYSYVVAVKQLKEYFIDINLDCRMMPCGRKFT